MEKKNKYRMVQVNNQVGSKSQKNIKIDKLPPLADYFGIVGVDQTKISKVIRDSINYDSLHE